MFKFIVLLTSLIIAGVAAFFSVSGLAKLFAGSFGAVVVMASALEVGKLVTASLLTRSWNKLSKILKIYYMTAVGVLIIITSAGIYGFLTSAYQITSDELRLLERQVSVIESQKERYQEQLDQSDQQLQSVNESITQLTSGLSNNQIQYVDPETGQLVTSTSRATREALQAQLDVANAERTTLNERRQSWNDSITSLDLQVIELQSNSEVAAEVGPLRYISNLTGMEMDKIVNYFALMIIFVFDPLAVTLVIAFNRLHMEGRSRSTDPAAKNVGPDEDFYTSKPLGSEPAVVTVDSSDIISNNYGDTWEANSTISTVTPENITYTSSEAAPIDLDWSDYDEELMDTALNMTEENEIPLDKAGANTLDYKGKEHNTPSVIDRWSALSRNKRD